MQVGLRLQMPRVSEISKNRFSDHPVTRSPLAVRIVFNVDTVCHPQRLKKFQVSCCTCQSHGLPSAASSLSTRPFRGRGCVRSSHHIQPLAAMACDSGLRYGDHPVWLSQRLPRRFPSQRVISPDFSLELTGFFPGKHLIHFLVLKMKDF